MTNPDMVAKKKGPGGPRLPEPNLAQPQPVPAPESEPAVWTREEPLDSPQPQPLNRQDKSKGLGTKR
jgi:hypothetical protein